MLHLGHSCLQQPPAGRRCAHHHATRRRLPDQQAAVDGLLPHSKSRARGAPGIHDLGIAPGLARDPFDEIEDEGVWEELWQLCIGDRAGIDAAPEPPAIGA